MKENILLIVITAMAILSLIIGIAFPFVNVHLLEKDYANSEYISALFSLSGVLLFCAALIYQVREYKLQVNELKKSVEAQTKSSEALEEQKLLLLEQNTNSLIFSMIDSFNEFKRNEVIASSIEVCFNKCKQKFNAYSANITTTGKSKNEFNKTMAEGVKSIFTDVVKSDLNIYHLKKFAQFAYNILYLIDLKKIPNQKDWFTPFLHIHFSKEEALILHLICLVDHGMPLTDKLQWNYYLVLDLVEMINPDKDRDQFKLMDAHVLTEELNQLKQKL